VPGYRENATETRTADKARLACQASISPAPVDMVQKEPRKISWFQCVRNHVVPRKGN